MVPKVFIGLKFVSRVHFLPKRPYSEQSISCLDGVLFRIQIVHCVANQTSVPTEVFGGVPPPPPSSPSFGKCYRRQTIIGEEWWQEHPETLILWLSLPVPDRCIHGGYVTLPGSVSSTWAEGCRDPDGGIPGVHPARGHGKSLQTRGGGGGGVWDLDV